MKTPPVQPVARQPSSDAKPEAASHRPLDVQVSRLFGESLFGAWLDPLAAAAPSQGQRKRGRWTKRLGIFLLVVLVASAGTWVYERGRNRKVEQERTQAAKDVATFLVDGELGRLGQFLAILAPPDQPLRAADPYLDLIVSAEAALYRYQDAAPARLARIAPYLSSDPSQPSRLLARLTVASEPERALAYDTLVSLLSRFSRDPEYHTLMATLLEQRGEVKAARESWERSAQAGPLWLPHRYLQCAFEARQRNAPAVARIAGHMAQVAPESAWTRMAHQYLARTVMPTSAGAANPPSPVAQYHAELALAIQSMSARSLAQARPALGRSLASANNQAPFVLDAFAALLSAKAVDLAIEMSSYEAWPRNDRWAEAKLAELQASVADRNRIAAPAGVEAKPAPEPAKTSAKKASAKKKIGKAKKKTGKANKKGSRRRK